MTDLSTLYQQLQSLAEERQVDIETLIQEMQASQGKGMGTRPSSDYQDLLQSATHLVINTYNQNGVLQQLFRYIDRLLAYDIAFALINEGDRVVVWHYRVSNVSIDDQSLDGQEWQMSHVSFIEQLLAGDEFAILDASARERLMMIIHKSEIQSAVIIPFLNNSSVLGTLFLLSRVPNRYDSTSIEPLLPFVRLASGALHNVRLMATVNQSADELAALYHATSVLFRADDLQDFASQITEVVVRAFDYTDCGLMIVDEDKGEIVRAKRSGPQAVQPLHKLTLDGKGLVPKAVREGRIIYEPDVRQSLEYVAGDDRSLCELVVPLTTPQGILGVLDFQSTQTYAFSERDKRIIVAFAERVAPALENVLLYDQLRRHTIELEQRVVERTLELQNTKEQLETIIRSSPDAIVLLGSQGIIKEANLSWLSMVGRSMRDVINQPFSSFLLEQDREEFYTALQRTLTDELENAVTTEIPHRTRHTSIEVEISLAPIIDGRGSGVVCNIRDITRHKNTERLLRQALLKSEELSQLKMNFVTMASHEFRTPLTTILSSSDIVSRYYERLSSEKILRHMGKIQNEVEYLNNLIDDILLIGRSGDEGFTAKYEQIDLSELIRGVMARIRATDRNRHFIKVNIAAGSETIVSDENLLAYVLDNLLSNACKYSEAGSPIVVEAHLDDTFHITVRDWGIGIPEDDLEQLFDTFHRGSNVGNISGTGIGLAIVQQAIIALNGQIHIESTLNQGTTVTIDLPLSTVPADVVSE